MIFPSYIFLLVFLPVVLALWYRLPGYRSRLIALTIASYVFYGWWDWRFVSLMLGSTLLDYWVGGRIHDADEPSKRRGWLLVSMAGNLGALGIFKYYGFFVGSAMALGRRVGVELDLPMLEVVLPVGISFYTFQSMSYSLDIYRRDCEPTAGFWEFAAYVAMFPQLVAGPIVRYGDIDQQLAALPNKKTDPSQIADGVWLFTIGLAKKVWIADLVAPLANRAFDGSGQTMFYTAWIGTFAYTFQLYFDFSGYSDMARGLGRMLGFEMPVNFDSPYKSKDISEFWNRWHITLSHWLRDYLYIPLGGSRAGLRKTLRNLTIVMFLGGLWHGAAWTFVVWGLFHGGLLVVNALWRRVSTVRLPRVLAVAVTFGAVMAGWVVFRADGMRAAKEIFEGMAGLNGFEPGGFTSGPYEKHLGPTWFGLWRGVSIVAIGAMVLAPLLAFFAPNSDAIGRPQRAWGGVLVGCIVFATLFRLVDPAPFLYFQF